MTKSKPIYPSDKQDQFMVRLPDGMRDRIKREAEKNGRSMNAEIVAALEEKYPPKTIDIQLLAEFLDLLGEDNDEDGRDIRQEVNDMFVAVGRPYTVKGDIGAITFYPYASPSQKREDK